MFDICGIHVATGVADAIAALQADENAVLVCGGSDVLIKVREGKLAGCSLVSIHGIDALRGVELEADGTVLIRPSTTFAGMTAHPIIQQCVPALGHAVNQAGGPQLRNVGTIGGNVCNGVTSADSASTLLTLNAELEITGPGGTRREPLEGFYKGPGRVNLAHDELLVAIRIYKRDYDGFGGHYIKYAMRNAMDIATLGCAVHVRLNDNLTEVSELRLGFGVAAPTPIRCHAAENAAAGRPVNEELFDTVAKTALTEVKPRTSWRASKEFRLQLVNQLSRRCLAVAIQNAGGETP